MSEARVAILSDMHCGAIYAPAPPHYNSSKTCPYAKVRNKLWETIEQIKAYKPTHVLTLGDMVDGKDKKGGGLECITTDMTEQRDMAAACLKYIRGKRKVSFAGISGTGYHIGNEEDWDEEVAKAVGYVKFGRRDWVEINGLIFDLKHKVGSSGVPHGRHTAISKSKLWERMWANRYDHPEADITLRGHVHYHAYSGDNTYLAMTLPAMCGMGSKYGIKECEGVVDHGWVEFNINTKGEYKWQSHIQHVAEQKPSVVKL